MIATIYYQTPKAFFIFLMLSLVSVTPSVKIEEGQRESAKETAYNATIAEKDKEILKYKSDIKSNLDSIKIMLNR